MSLQIAMEFTLKKARREFGYKRNKAGIRLTQVTTKSGASFWIKTPTCCDYLNEADTHQEKIPTVKDLGGESGTNGDSLLPLSFKSNGRRSASSC